MGQRRTPRFLWVAAPLVVALIGCRAHDVDTGQTDPTPATTVAATGAVPETTGARVGTSSTLVTMPDASPADAIGAVPVVEWLDASPVADGFYRIVDGHGTDARLLAETIGEAPDRAGVLLADDTVVALPGPEFVAATTSEHQSSIVGIGDHIGITGTWNDRIAAPEFWLLDPVGGTWSPGPALVERPTSPWTMTGMATTENGVLISIYDLFGEDQLADPPTGSFTLLSEQQELAPLASPPVGVESRFDLVIESRALLFNRWRSVDEQPQRNAWSFDLDRDEWQPIPNPTWLPCATTDACDWTVSVFQDLDRAVVPVGDSVLVEVVPDDLALLTPSTMTWVDVPEPPLDRSGHHLVAAGDDVVLAMPVDLDFDDESDVAAAIGVFDLSSATWSVIDVQIDLSWYRWLTVETAESLLLGDHRTEPATVFDLATRAFREPTSAERSIWLDEVSGWAYNFRGDDLIAAFSRR